MAKHNYSQYSNKKKTNNSDISSNAVKMEVKHESEPEVLMGPIVVEPVNETVDTVDIPKTVDGVVVNCVKLNVRAEANIDADILCVLNVMSEIKINVEKSTRDWFYVCTATGVEGYCMRKFVDAHL